MQSKRAVQRQNRGDSDGQETSTIDSCKNELTASPNPVTFIYVSGNYIEQVPPNATATRKACMLGICSTMGGPKIC